MPAVTVTGYRVELLGAPDPAELGTYYTLEAPSYDPAAYLARIHPVTIELGTGAKLARSGWGELLIYRNHAAYGKRLSDALSSGWCRLTETGTEPELA